MKNPYDKKYAGDEYYWGLKPSPVCFKVLQLHPPEEPLKLIDIGCGEGRNSIFFARNGYEVTAFDLSENGVQKTKRLADKLGVPIEAFKADIEEYRLENAFDVLFSTGVLHYIPESRRPELIEHYKNMTALGGLNVFSVFVKKPFIPIAPDAELAACLWQSGELFTYYHDWRIEYCTEEIFDCNSGGTPHQHAVNRMIAIKVKSQQTA